MNYNFGYVRKKDSIATGGIFTFDPNGDSSEAIPIKIAELSQLYTKYEHNLKKPHTRDFYVITWFQNARGAIKIDGISFDLQDNSIYFLGKSQMIEFSNIENVNGYTIAFPEKLFYNIKAEALPLLHSEIFLRNNYMHITEDDLTRSIISMFESLLKIQQSTYPDSIKYVNMQAIIISTLCLIYTSGDFKNLTNVSKNINNKAYKCFTAFLSVVDYHYKDNLSVQQYAKILGVSPRSLCYYIKEYSDLTPQQIIRNKIVMEIKRMLITTDKTIREIAYAMDMDSSNLSKLFKKSEGIGPIEYRKQYL